MLVKISFKDIPEAAKPFFNNYYSNGLLVRDDCYSYNYSTKENNNEKYAFKLLFSNGDYLSFIRGSIEVYIESRKLIVDLSGNISTIKFYHPTEEVLETLFDLAFYY